VVASPAYPPGHRSTQRVAVVSTMSRIRIAAMRRLPTDQEILEAIHSRHYKDFIALGASVNRASKIYVPIDIRAVAAELGVDPNSIFGRLYHYLNRKYGYKNDDGSLVLVFSPRIGPDENCVHFPLMESIIAGLQTEDRRFWLATFLSVISLAVSIVAIVVSVMKNP